ncbi:acetate/propionate family kinase [Flexivirga caeni]|uniref:Acetate kinase n=1 Tax=Flexivirga caeni TaxID=2294115 RepID=A0A3M9MG20_9MICO|nr:acetate kinase [Flexivirga caeni]RNI23833.1 acetate kinase [Flexivirga caeni]
MTDRVLVLNAGSSSLKLQVVRADSGVVEAQALVERLGSDDATFRVTVGDRTADGRVDSAGHAQTPAVATALGILRDQLAHLGFDLDGEPPVAIGHRVVHGGRDLTRPVRIDDRVIAQIASVSALAPLHNPANVAGIRAAIEEFPGTPQVAVFDTGFFADLPETAATYAIDRQVAADAGIQRYGFHGTSNEFVSAQAARFLGRDLAELRQIVLHLGNGASASAIAGGRPVDTSMGMTPLEGLVMGTRAGDLDPGILLQLARTGDYDVDALDHLISRRSGLLGLTGRSDMRDVCAAAESGDEAALLALDVVGHRLRKYVGAYAAVLGGLDVLTFTAGVGENSAPVRSRAVAGLEFLGIRLDSARNECAERGARRISTDDSAVTVLVVPTNEELAIARHTLAVVGQD